MIKSISFSPPFIFLTRLKRLLVGEKYNAFFAIHNKALSDKISEKFFLIECPIESCYVCGGFRLNSLAKKAPGGRSW